jgi:dolichol-phosphate mannosyltransferase
LSFLSGLTYIILKIFNWDGYPLGLAPFIIGNFFLFGVLFIFVGIIGEYILSIQTYVKKRPLVIEKDRINF